MEELATEIRTENSEERIISGLAVPYGKTVERGGVRERIERGAFASAKPGAAVYFQHDHRDLRTPIGSIVDLREEEDGLHVKVKLSSTDKGNEVYTLVKDKVLKHFSVGFNPVEGGVSVERDGTQVWKKADLKELSIVDQPFYVDARIQEVREETSTLPEIGEIHDEERGRNVEEIQTEVAEVRDELSNLKREFGVFKERQTEETAIGSQYRSLGEVYLAAYNGEEAAVSELRAYEGATLSDTVQLPTYLGEAYEILAAQQKVTNAFQRRPAPSELEAKYARLLDKTGNAAVTAEAADLPYVEVSHELGTVQFVKAGAYVEVTAEIMRAGLVDYLNDVTRYAVERYGAIVEGRTRTELANAEVTGTAVPTDLDGWIDLVIDESARLDSVSTQELNTLIVSKDVFKSLAKLTDGGEGSVLQFAKGTANPKGLSFSLLGIQGLVDTGAADGTVYLGNSNALITWESAGAPVAKRAENIVNLTELRSFHGFTGVKLVRPELIRKVEESGS